MTAVSDFVVFRPQPADPRKPGSTDIPSAGLRGWALFVVGEIFALFSSWGTFRNRGELVAAAERGDCKVIPGPVWDFVRLRGSGSQPLAVDCVYFKYSDFRMTGAFNHSAGYGGPIEPDCPTGICYVAGEELGDNRILQLEVAS